MRNAPPSRQRVEDLNRQVLIFNEAVKEGDRVTYKRDGGDLFHTRTRSKAYILGGHTAAIFVDDISGCVLLSRVMPDKGPEHAQV